MKLPDRLDLATSQPSTFPSVGWIGTGAMGASMCSRLLAHRLPVTVHTRTKTKAEGLLGKARVGRFSPRPR